MRFLADECCDTGLVAFLRDEGHDVQYTFEKDPGAKDEEVLSNAYDDNRILLTEDKDFGELVYRLRRPSKGIVLIRIDVEDRQLKKVMLSRLISQYSDRLAGAFAVVEASRFRFRPLIFEV